MTAPRAHPSWRNDPEVVMPTVLVVGGFLTSPPFYWPLRRRLLERGAAAVVIAPIWLPDWLVMGWVGPGRLLGRAGRALQDARQRSMAEPASGGAPVLLVGHSAGGLLGRLLTSEEPIRGRRYAAAPSIGAIVTLGTPFRLGGAPHDMHPVAFEMADAAARHVPGAAHAPTIGYVSVGSRRLTGRGRRPYERLAQRLYRRFDPAAPRGPVESDGLVPLRLALLEGTRHVVLGDVAHGQLARAPWYGSDEALDAWWPPAVDAWRGALRARLAGVDPTAV